MYKLIRLFKNSFNQPCVELETPSGKIKKRLITPAEEAKIMQAMDDAYKMDILLYGIA